MVDVSIIIVGNTSDNQRIKTMHAAINKTSIDPKYKEWLERICTALVANIKEFDETLFLENIKTLEIKTVSYEGAASQKGEYNCFENTISLCEHNVGDLSFFSFAHECIHFMSTDRRNVITKTKDERGRIACPSGFAMGYETGGVRTGYSHGINEGMTERILRKALRPPKSRTVYIFQTSCLLVLDNFIFNGELTKLYFKGGIPQEFLNAKILPLLKEGWEDFVRLLRTLDNIFKICALDYELTNETAKNYVIAKDLILDMYESHLKHTPIDTETLKQELEIITLLFVKVSGEAARLIGEKELARIAERINRLNPA